ncbi:farnesoate epoxidase-like [Augochlora pura]
MAAIAILVVLIVILLLSRKHIRFIDEKRPPGPLPWPIIGNHLLLKQLSVKYGGLHQALIKLSKQYRSDLITLYFGTKRGLIIGGNKLLRLKLKDGHFDGRPFDEFGKIRNFGKKQGITLNEGAVWKELRSWTFNSLKDFGLGSHSMSNMITDELVVILENLSGGGVKSLKPIIAPAAINVLWYFTMGKNNAGSKLQYLMELMEHRSRLVEVSGGLLSIFPWLRHIAPQATGYKQLVELTDELKNFFMENFKAHKMDYVPGRKRDLTDKFIAEMMKNQDADTVYKEEQLLVILVDLFLAGFSTIGTVLEFLFLHMIIHQDVQRKLQKELDSVIPSDRHPDVSDRLKLPYAEAVLAETLRLWPLFPLIPRRALRDAELENYVIPGNTTVLLNCYAANRDPEFYPEPDIFNPERHLKNGKYETDANSTTFGIGKRKCPGSIFAKSAIFILFLGIMQKFTLLPVPGKEPKSVEIKTGYSIAPKPYEVLLVPR